MKGKKFAALGGACLLLGACAGPVVLGLNLGTVATVGSVASTATTGKGLGEHAVSAVAERDCRLIESIVRKERQFCEEYGSPAQKEDFRGVAEWFEPKEEPQPIMLAEISPQAGADIVVDRPESETAAARAVEAEPIEPVAGIAVAPETPPPTPLGQTKATSPSRNRVAAAPPPPKAKPAVDPPAATVAAATTAPRPAVNGTGSGSYRVRVGTYANAGAAEAFARKLRQDGYQARISQIRGAGRKTWSVIHLTGFRDAAAAERAAAAVAREHDLAPGIVLAGA